MIRFDNRDIGLSSHLSELGKPDLASAMAKAMAGENIEAPYSLDDMAEDAVQLLRALGVDSAHIVGASMGGMIAQIVAARHPDATRSLISIMSTTGRRDLPPAQPQAMAVLTSPPASNGRLDRIRAGINVWKVIGSPGFREADDELEAKVAREVDRAPYDPDGIGRQMLAILAAPPRNDLLATVRVPARVIHGADDPLIPLAAGHDTAAAIPGAELVVVPGMGHGFESALVPVYLEQIGDFVATVEQRARG
ncbi:MAG: alpha/beta fold hydrolase [Alphaproteobacteria bacterium]|nr:alpha/beta fold hydrolase [Alphaproteobacteria bacterium]